ncbi:MAG: HIT domain-containing protein [Candidatus Omnitrophica bacterium]|nr:HIT domain-containing protein [Candidatus Omnitrophota bacterium]
MNRIWAPWRIGYVQKKSKGCIFCRAAKSRLDKKYYVVYRSKFCFSILNVFPYNNGHIMIAPYRHRGDIADLTNDELLDLIKVLKISQRQLDKVLRPQAYNIGINIGKEAGAGFAGHLHVHIVPRWKGDANFMPVIFDTKIISQSLKQLHNKLTIRKR